MKRQCIIILIEMWFWCYFYNWSSARL